MNGLVIGRLNRYQNLSQSMDKRSKLFYLPFFVLSGMIELGHFGMVRFGDASPDQDMFVWRSIGNAVIQNDVPLYIGMAWDNKPPLFELLNLLFTLSGEYYISFLFAVALSNGLSACIIYKISSRINGPGTGILAALLFFSLLPALNGVNTTPRPFAVTALLLSIYISSPIQRGVAIGISGLFIQVTGTAAIPLGLVGMANNQKSRYYISAYLLSIAITIAIGYSLVGVLWSTNSLVAAINHSIVGAVEYASGGTSRYGLATTLMIGILAAGVSAVQLPQITIPFVIGLYRANWGWFPPKYSLRQTLFLVSMFLLPVAVLRAADDYLFAPFTVMAILAAGEIRAFINR